MMRPDAVKQRFGWCPAVILLIVLLVSCSVKKQTASYSNLIMGTFCDLAFTPVPGINSNELAAKIFDRLRYLEGLWSIYQKESEVSRLNREGNLKPSPETLTILKKSLEISRISNGAFDITVAPLMTAWRESEKAGKLPDLKSLVPLIGYRKIAIGKNGTVRFLKKGMAIDLGGIGKGAAVDEAVSLLKSAGVKSGIVNLGGNLYVFGDGPHQGRWKVGIQNPRGSGAINAISVKNQGVSTSGNYQQYFEIGGKRYSHILNPKTGSLPDYPESVTVIAPTAALADGLSTAFTVLGPADAISLADTISGVETLIIMPGPKSYRTKGFPAIM
ncbi:MAG: FAD:protein FMN transferase [Candidatus Omnitrophota bacterium]|nr:FAD:protein FMN transferase [Candidatus Omnitrophota bacterium]